MAAVRTNPLHLFARGRPSGDNQPLGSLAITGIDPPWSGEGGLRLGIEYRPPNDPASARRVVGLDAAITSTWPTQRPCGRVRLLADPPGQPGILGAHVTSLWWLWSLAPDEVESIERDRAPNAAAETVSFNLEVRGIATLGPETWGFGGDTQFSIPTADWLSLVRSLGYTTPPSLQDLVGQSMTGAASWTWAHERIQIARRQLALGEDRQALTTAHLLFDAIARNPYRAEWTSILDAEMPLEKAEIIRDLLRANATALNKLGRHPADSLTDGRDRRMLSLDHWEAELLIAVSQLLLAAVERWRSIREVQGPPPPARSDPEPSPPAS